MSRRICILADVRYVTAVDTADPDDMLEVYRVEAEDGLPGGNWRPVYTEPYNGPGNVEFWRCNNCGNKKGSWADMRQHLGRFHELIDPFNYPEAVPDG